MIRDWTALLAIRTPIEDTTVRTSRAMRRIQLCTYCEHSDDAVETGGIHGGRGSIPPQGLFDASIALLLRTALLQLLSGESAKSSQGAEHSREHR